MMTYRFLRGKGFWLFLVLPLLLWGVYRIYESKTLIFSSARITSDFPYDRDLAIEEPSGKKMHRLKTLFRQKFKFLGAGAEAYAFVSEDGKTVIKFFKMRHQIPRLSDLGHPEVSQRRRLQILSSFRAHKLAYENLREDSGLIYIHLNKGSNLQTKLQVMDRLGRTHLIDLDNVEFVIQEKAELIFTHLQKLIEKNDQAAVKKSVDAVLELVQRRIDLGISDQDKAVKHNFGFIGNRPIHLDIGRIEKVRKPHEYDRINQRINKWLQNNDTSLSSSF